jgi:DNA primase
MPMNPYAEYGKTAGSQSRPDLPRICADLRDRFPVSAAASQAGVKLQRAGRELKGCCPFHPDRTPSFTIYADDRRFQCFGCGAEGDVLDFVQRAYNVKLLGAIEMLDGGSLRELEQQRVVATPKADWSKAANSIWTAALPIQGTPAEAYLLRRGITMDLPQTLRFARLRYPQEQDRRPALVAAVCSPSGDLTGIQRTFLTEDGRKAVVPEVKLSLGRVAGGSIQLGPPSASLVVTEGLEDGLTLAQALGRSVWVSAGTSMLPRMELADVTQAIVIGADSDAAGEAAANKAAHAFAGLGRRVRIMLPAPGFKDFNAELMGASA